MTSEAAKFMIFQGNCVQDRVMIRVDVDVKIEITAGKIISIYTCVSFVNRRRLH